MVEDRVTHPSGGQAPSDAASLVDHPHGDPGPLQFDSGSTREIAEKALDGLKGLIELYANPAQPYYSKPRVEFIWNVADYDRLARRAEWSADEGGDE